MKQRKGCFFHTQIGEKTLSKNRREAKDGTKDIRSNVAGGH